LPRKGLLSTRARFLADCGWGRHQEILSSLERRDRQLVDALRDAHVVLWFEHDLYDQLQLLDVLTLAHAAEAAPELIVIGSFPGKPSFAGLGELTAGELETLWPSRRTAAPAALEAATGAWEALRAAEPTTLAGWATRENADLPFLAPALRRLLDADPDLVRVEVGAGGSLLGEVAQPDVFGTSLGRALGVDRACVDLLIERGSDLDGPLNLAACFDRVELVEILLAAGARADARGIYGITPLESAIYHASRAAADVLAAIALVPDAPWVAAGAGRVDRLERFLERRTGQLLQRLWAARQRGP
jgi:hypothetical protein